MGSSCEVFLLLLVAESVESKVESPLSGSPRACAEGPPPVGAEGVDAEVAVAVAGHLGRGGEGWLFFVHQIAKKK